MPMIFWVQGNFLVLCRWTRAANIAEFVLYLNTIHWNMRYEMETNKVLKSWSRYKTYSVGVSSTDELSFGSWSLVILDVSDAALKNHYCIYFTFSKVPIIIYWQDALRYILFSYNYSTNHNYSTSRVLLA